jgi:hypothetical protein
MQKIIAIVGGALLVGAGFAAGYLMNPRTDMALREKLDKAKAYFAEKPYALTSGRIQKISDGRVTIKVLTNDPFYQGPLEREVIIGPSVPVIKIEYKSKDELDRNWLEYKRAVAASTSSGALMPPVITAQRTVRFADLKVGDFIEAETASEVTDELEVSATKVIISMSK